MRNIAFSLKGTTEAIKWGDHLCFSVGNKMYLVTSPDQVPSTSAFNVPADELKEIIAREDWQNRHIWAGTIGST